jgi:hypothetical protein
MLIIFEIKPPKGQGTGVFMTIKTFWALPPEISKQHLHAVTSWNDLNDKAVTLVKDKTGCDEVLRASNGSIYPGFKHIPPLVNWRKNPAYCDGYYLMIPKAKTPESIALIEACNILKSGQPFDEYCKAKWPKMVQRVAGSSLSIASVITSKTSFGYLKGHLVAMVPFVEGKKIDKSIIAEGFIELTASQYADLAAE